MPPVFLLIVGLVTGAVFGYLAGAVWADPTLVPDAEPVVLQVTAVILVIIYAVLFLILPLLQGLVTIGSGGFWANLLAVALVVLSMSTVVVIKHLSSDALKVFGLVSSLFAIALAVLPSVALLATAVK